MTHSTRMQPPRPRTSASAQSSPRERSATSKPGVAWLVQAGHDRARPPPVGRGLLENVTRVVEVAEIMRRASELQLQRRATARVIRQRDGGPEVCGCLASARAALRVPQLGQYVGACGRPAARAAPDRGSGRPPPGDRAPTPRGRRCAGRQRPRRRPPARTRVGVRRPALRMHPARRGCLPVRRCPVRPRQRSVHGRPQQRMHEADRVSPAPTMSARASASAAASAAAGSRRARSAASCSGTSASRTAGCGQVTARSAAAPSTTAGPSTTASGPPARRWRGGRTQRSALQDAQVPARVPAPRRLIDHAPHVLASHDRLASAHGRLPHKPASRRMA